MRSALLEAEATVIGDGGMGTMLQAAGLPLGAAPERWNLERLDAVLAVHAAYAAAGAAWVQTNTFGATRPRLVVSRLGRHTREVNGAAVAAARRGAPGLPILGSMGPTDEDPAVWVSGYEEQARALGEARVDGFMVETIVSIAEGMSAVAAAAAEGIGPVFASFTPSPGGDFLDGTPLEQGAEALVKLGADVIGVNCGTGPESLLAPARRLVAMRLCPVLASPSAGLPEVVRGRATYALGPDGFAEAAIQFQEAGVRFVGGCCGTTPEHIRAAARALRSHPVSPRL
jgi:5-methyltetrahydrofolate--homocysteine methyltransferase